MWLCGMPSCWRLFMWWIVGMAGAPPRRRRPAGEPWRVEGLWNLVFLAVILGLSCFRGRFFFGRADAGGGPSCSPPAKRCMGPTSLIQPMIEVRCCSGILRR